MNLNKYLYRPAAIVSMLAIVVGMVVLSPLPLAAQSFYGSIVGTVADNSGAIVPGATVTIINKSTNEKHTATSSGSGDYQFVSLVPATYTVTVERANFKRYVRDTVTVGVNTTVRVDAALQVGEVTETIEVNTAQTVQLQTDSPTVSNKVEAQQVAELPLNGRNMMQLLNITAGVMAGSAVEQGATLAQNNGTSSNPLSWGGGSNAYTINGGDNEEYIDGAPINMIQGSNIGIMPTADAIQEFNIDTNVGDASEGRATGGVINETTKSGTNNLHWTAYDYFRNADLNANNFFNKRNGLGTPKQNQNLYGFNLGFPIKKNKIFFFGSYEVDNVVGASPTFTNVPTNGNSASQSGLANGGSTDLWDGLFTRQINDPTGNCPTIAGAQPAALPYAGKNIIFDASKNTWTMGQACWDQVSTVMRTFFATQPNTANSVNNYTVNIPVGNIAPEMNARVDWNVNDKHRAFAHFAWWQPLDKPFQPFPNPNVPSALAGGKAWGFGSAVGGFGSNLYIVGDTYTINPRTVLDLRAEWLRFRFTMLPKVNNFDLSSISSTWGGFSSYAPNGNHWIPAPTFNGGSAVHNFAPSGLGFTNGASGTFGPGGQGQQWDNYGLNGTLNYVAGKHSLKAGFEARLMDMELLYSGFNSGAPSFGLKYSNYTNPSNLQAPGCQASIKNASGQSVPCGDEWADFMMGYFTSLSFGGSFGGTEFNRYQAYFASDTWQFNRKLTLSLGLRWELPGGLMEKKDSTFVFLPTTTDPNTGTYGTEVLVNTAQAPSRSIFPIKKKLVDPRIGFAYRLNDKTVVRGGFGITHQAVDEDSGGNGAPGVALNNEVLNWSNPNNGSGTVAPTATLANPIPNIPQVFVPRLGRSNPNFLKQYAVGSQVSGGTALNGFANNQPLPYFEQYNFAVQHQFGNRFQITASYVGSQGVHLKTGGPIDQIPYAAYTVNTTGTAVAGSTGNQVPTQTATAASGTFVGQNITNNVPVGGTITLQNGATQSFANGYFCSPNKAFCNNNIKVGRTLQPYPNYSNATIGNLSYGHQTYNALQINSQWRIQGGGLLGAAYTWAKTLNDTTGQQDYWNHRGDRTVAGVPMRLVFNFNYPLPLGRGQRYLNTSNPVMGRVISGWTLNNVTSYQHGNYLAISNNSNNQLQQNFGANTTRASYVPGGYTVIGGNQINCNSKKTVNGADFDRLGQWFNTGCYQYPGDYSFGNTRQNEGSLYAAGIHNWDLSLLKTTKITEKANLQLRVETFNTFNHFQPGAPNTQVGNGNYGKVTTQANNPRQVQISLRVSY